MAIIQKIHKEIETLMQRNEFRERLLQTGIEPEINSPEEFAKFIQSETTRYAKVIAASGARID